MDYEKFIRELRPEWARSEVKISQLRSGIFNHPPFLVQSSNGSFVVRRFGKGTEFFVNRQVEAENLRRLAKTGRTSTLAELREKDHTMIFNYIPGRSTVADDFRDKEKLRKIIEAFRTIHQSEVELVNTLEPFAEIERYMQRASELGTFLISEEPVMKLHRAVRKVGARINSANNFRAPCHNDLLPGNIVLADDGRVCIIDWEFGGMCDPAYDLADFLTELEGASDWVFDREGEEEVLKLYFRTVSKDTRDKITIYKLVARYLWLLWAIIQYHASDIDFEYDKYAREQLELCLGLLKPIELKFPEMT